MALVYSSLVLTSALVVVLKLIYMLPFLLVTMSMTLTWNGENDADLSDSSVACDISRVRVSKEAASGIDTLDHPVLLGGLMTEWPATHIWTKEYLIDTYGDDLIRTGTESSIVYSGGVAEKRLPLRQVIEGLSCNSTSLSDRLFVFDTTVTRSNPQWLKDVPVPSLFANWDNPENEDRGQVWHMLSLGSSHSGLPRHYHGQTWLGLLKGGKKWFIYPPGYTPPPSVEAAFNPLLPVSDWIREVFPQLVALPKPPLYKYFNDVDDASASSAAVGYRPLVCVQREGEVMYLPKGWSHITVNIGETLAFGGQQRSTDDIQESFRLLKERPGSYDIMRDIGLAKANAANTLKRRLQDLHGSGVIVLHSVDQLNLLLAETRDSWLVAYCPTEKCSLDNVERRLHGTVNVAVMELPHAENQSSVLIKLHRGMSSSQVSLMENQISAIDRVGVVYEGDITDVRLLETFVLGIVRSQDLHYGSISTVPTSVLLLYTEGIQYLRSALSIKYHPETYNLLCEIVAETDDQASLSECISTAVRICDSMIDDQRVSRLTLSSIFHRLARIFLQKNVFRAVIPLLQRSLRLNPYNAAALRDQVIVYVNLRDKALSVHSLHVMESNVVNCSVIIEDYQPLREAVLAM